MVRPYGTPLLTEEAVPDELAVRLPLAVGLAELVSELEAVDVSLGVALTDDVCACAERQGRHRGRCRARARPSRCYTAHGAAVR